MYKHNTELWQERTSENTSSKCTHKTIHLLPTILHRTPCSQTTLHSAKGICDRYTMGMGRDTRRRGWLHVVFPFWVWIVTLCLVAPRESPPSLPSLCLSLMLMMMMILLLDSRHASKLIPETKSGWGCLQLFLSSCVCVSVSFSSFSISCPIPPRVNLLRVERDIRVTTTVPLPLLLLLYASSCDHNPTKAQFLSLSLLLPFGKSRGKGHRCLLGRRRRRKNPISLSSGEMFN